MTGHSSARLLAALVAVALLTSCEIGPQPPVTTKRLLSQSTSYTDHDKQQRFKEALRQAGVSHEIYTGDDKREYVKWKGEDSATVEQIQVSLFGEPLPEGRSIHFGAPYNDRFKKWLTDSGIPFTTRLSDGKEYVIWEAADYPRVAKWEHFPRETYEKVHQLSSNPTVDTDARKSGARGSP
jgi:hypothetical protein